jgi:predicted metal-dependent phosphoesterase TrpH
MSSPKRMLRGIIHCHSEHSYDSVTPVSAYLRFARKQRLDFIILTDHETTAGSRELHEMAGRRMPELQVPIAAEYKTDQGDIIAAFLQEEISERSYVRFLAMARAQQALLLLPHPYVAHTDPERLASDCDLIEVFNSRARRDANERAGSLAAEKRKPAYAGSDAHLYRSLRRAVIEVADQDGLRRSLITSPIIWTASETPRWEIAVSQLTKSWKNRDLEPAIKTFHSGFRFVHKRLMNGI